MALTKTPIELSSTPSIVDGGNATAITIDSSENVLVGKSALEYENTAGHIFRNDGLQSSIRNGGNVADFNRLSSDGEIIRLSKDGATVGAIATWDGDLAVGQENVALKFNDGSNEILPWSVASNLNRDNAFNLGSSSSRFKDLYLSGGAYLGGTAAANKLDSYEEGTWTPTVAGCSINVGRAYYTKIGNLVTANFNFTVTATDGSVNSFAIGGRPFAGSSANAESNGSLMLNYFTADANVVNVSLYTYSRESLIYIYQTITGSSWTLVGRDQIQVSPATAIIGSITYETDT